MRSTHLISTILICSLSSAMSLAQVDGATNPDTQAQKYNGYGLPNTKYKKVKVKNAAAAASASTDNSTATKKIAPVTKAAPVTQTPVSTLPTSTEAAKTTAVPAAAEPFFKLSMDWNSSYNTQMQKQPDGTKDEYIQHEFTPKMKLGDYTVTGDFYYDDHFKYPDNSDYEDGTIILGRKAWEAGSYVKLAPSGGVLLPLSRGSREKNGIKDALIATLTLGMNSKNLGLDKWTLSWASSYYKFETEFDTNPSGDPSLDYRLRQFFTLGYSFTDKFSFIGVFRFDSNTFVQGVTKNRYLHAEIFNYQWVPMFATWIAHSSAGNVFSIEGPDDNAYLDNSLKFYDPQASELAIGITLSF